MTNLLIDSGYGSYLLKSKPQAIANEFLLYNPSLLLWVDEFYCDETGYKEEEKWAEKGFLISEITKKLKENKIIKPRDFSLNLSDVICENLINESNNDFEITKNINFGADALPRDLNNSIKVNGFYDINVLLMLSATENIPFLIADSTKDFYNFKFAKFSKIIAQNDIEKERQIRAYEQVIDFHIPNLELFPKNKMFSKAEKAKLNMLKNASLFEQGKIDKKKYDESYDLFLKLYLKYDKEVKSEVYENFAMFLEFREDKRIKNFRAFINQLTEKLKLTDYSKIDTEILLNLKKELLLNEYSIAEKSDFPIWLEKFSSHITFPVQAFTNITGVLASYMTQNPFFLALGLYPTFIDYLKNRINDSTKSNYLWQTYLHDANNKVERTKKIRDIEKQLNLLEKK